MDKTKIHKISTQSAPIKNDVFIEYLEMTFLFDVTGSMGSCIEMVKNNIKGMVDSIVMVTRLKLFDMRKKLDFVVIPKVSLIAYRDFCDSVMYEYLPFTTEIDDVYNALKQISASGGGDMPEDVFGAFTMFMNKYESSNDNITKILILITDAPGHGKLMCDGGDSHVDKGGSEETWKTYMNTLKKEKIEFICIKMTQYVDKMLSFFQKIYNDDNNKMGIVNGSMTDTEKMAEELTKCTSKYCIDSLQKRYGK